MNRLRSGTILLILICTMVFCPVAAGEIRTGTPIPVPPDAGVPTGMQEAVGEEPVKVAVLNNFPPFSFMLRGKLMGFTIDYLYLLERKTGISFEITGGTWENNLNRFRKGEVDMITAISYTSERARFTRYTDPYYIIPTVVYIREGSFSYQGVRDLAGKTVGIESEVFYKTYLKQYPLDIREIEDTNELMRRLSFGEIDAVVTNINIGNFMVKNHMLSNVILAGRIDIPAIRDEDLRIGVRLERPGLHAAVQAGMNQVSPAEYKELQERWVGFTPNEMLKNTFLPDESNLIKQQTEKYGGLRLAGHTNWRPVDFFGGGEHKGIAADIFAIVGRENDISFVHLDKNDLDGAVAAVVAGEADIIPAVVPEDRLSGELVFTKPYLSLPLVIATRRSEIFIRNLHSLGDKQIGFVNRGDLGTMLERRYPRLTFVDTGSTRKGLQRVKSGSDFAFVGSVPGITEAIRAAGFYDIKISGTLKESLPVAAAVRKDNETLRNIVQNSLNSVSPDIREEVVGRWIPVRFDEKADYRLIWAVVGAAFVSVAAVVLWTRKVRVYNARLSEAYRLLEEKNRQLEKLSNTDKLTGLCNRSRMDESLEQEKARFERTGTGFSIIMLDIDWFKSINDTFGHITGDRVLREFADRLRKRARESDIVGRWGGEEFLIVCPGTDVGGAGRMAEDIREDILSHDFGLGRPVAVSAGVAACTRDLCGVEELVNAADKELYTAKKHRNRVSVSQDI